MSAKDDTKSHLKIFVEGKERGRFEVPRRNGEPTGKLLPTKRSRLVDREVNLRAALDDYLAVASIHELWEQSDEAHRYAEDPRIVAQFNLDADELRHRGKHRHRLREEFESALVEATNTHGPLGVGNWISDILGAIRNLQLFVVPDEELSKFPGFIPGVVKVHPDVITNIRASMYSCDVGRGGVACPDLFSALLWYVYLTGLPFRVCDVCKTAFVTRKGRTCSPRCRQRKRYQAQRG
jgi:hypothetical protein